MKIVIDNEFRTLIPPLSAEERAQLEANILADGCRDPLVVWGEVLIDGHNRHEICTKHGLPFKVISRDFPGREAAMDWIDANQLGRRNITPDQFTLLLGRRYNRAKKAQGGRADREFGAAKVTSPNTAEKLAAEHGVSEKTVRNAGHYAEAVAAVEKAVPGFAQSITAPRQAVIKAAAIIEKSPEKAAEILRGDKSLADVRREEKREEIIERLESVKAIEAKATSGVFDVIVIDPPWQMQKIERDVRPNQAEFDYPTMSEEELAALEIPAADDCHVWVWTTHKFLPMTLRLLDAWGMKYVCTFVWHKPGGFQPIGLPQYNSEFAVYARIGTPEFIDTKAFNTCFDAPRGAHSEKPEEFYQVVRRVTAGRRLDMFNRRPIDGFEVWGKESEVQE
jgi:N6-adenosine-specific RNA methylase IME4